MKRIITLIVLLFGITFIAACGKKGPAKIEGSKSVNVRQNDPNFNLLDGLTATDEAKGDVLKKVTHEGSVDVTKEGAYDVIFTVKGSDGKEVSFTRTYHVKPIVIKGAEDRKVTLGVSQFDPLAGISVVDPVDSTLAHQGATKRVDVTVVITQDGEEVEKINTQELGEYVVTYSLTYKGVSLEVVRNISIVDEISWTGAGAYELEIGLTFVPTQGVQVIQPVLDEEGNRVTRNLTEFIRVVKNEVDNAQPGEYEVAYKIEDPDTFDHENPDPNREMVFIQTNGADEIHTRIVTVFNKIELRGAANTQVTKGQAFDLMEGVSARDSIGAIDASKISVAGQVDVTELGEYQITYTVTGSFNDTLVHKRVVTVVPPIAGKVDLYFMSGDPVEQDPFHKDFKGSFPVERQQLQRAAEEELNVKIHYVPYPDNAAWGPSRVAAMIDAHVNGKPLADVFYHISSDWIPQLATGGAIAPVDEFLAPGQIGEDMHPTIREAGKYANKVYGFSAGALNIEAGFYYNADLVAKLGLPNPTDKYLANNWSWNSFQEWALTAKTALAADEYVLGGAISYYAENLVPLNGGELINEARRRIDFDNAKALETYDYIKALYDAELFEPNRKYDSGSAEWQAGKVIFHPGHFWFLGATNRWKDVLKFEVGFVPWPMSDAYIASNGVYRSPIYGPSFPVMANGLTTERKALAFKAWHMVQRRVPQEQALEEFEALLRQRFDKDNYVEAYLTVYDKAYRSLLESLGIGGYDANSFKLNINKGIVENNWRTLLSQIKPQYQDKLDRYLDAT